jgi:hypothetical protein
MLPVPRNFIFGCVLAGVACKPAGNPANNDHPVPAAPSAAAAEHAGVSAVDADTTPAPAATATDPAAAAFRASCAPLVAAQVDRAAWGAFVPLEGVPISTAACISLLDGSVSPNATVRVCDTANFEARIGPALRVLAKGLASSDRSASDWSCTEKECTLQGGEMGISATLTFALVGSEAKVVHMHEPCGGAFTADTLEQLAKQKPAKAPPACGRRPR